jgi:hypothetical protein
MKKLAQKSAVSIVKFQPPLPEVIRQSKEVQQLKREKTALLRRFSALMKQGERGQVWCACAAVLVDDAKVWKKRSETKFEPWRVEAHEAHKLVTSTLGEFISSVDSMARATEGARVSAVLKAQADMRLRQANLDADAEKANAQRPEEEQAPAALVAPEIEGSTGRKIWCADRHKFDLMDYLLWFVVTAPRSIYSVPAVVPDWAALDAFAKSGRDTALLPGFNFGHKIAGTDLFIPNPVKK